MGGRVVHGRRVPQAGRDRGRASDRRHRRDRLEDLERTGDHRARDRLPGGRGSGGSGAGGGARGDQRARAPGAARSRGAGRRDASPRGAAAFRGAAHRDRGLDGRWLPRAVERADLGGNGGGHDGRLERRDGRNRDRRCDPARESAERGRPRRGDLRLRLDRQLREHPRAERARPARRVGARHRCRDPVLSRVRRAGEGRLSMSDEHTAIGEVEAEAAEPGKKGFEFPGTLTVLVIVTFLVWLAAFIIPAGQYQHDESGVPTPGSYERVDAPQAFDERVEDFFLAPVNGLYGLQDPETGFVQPFGIGRLFGAVGVFAFVLAIGAFMTIVLATGALDVAIGKLAYAVRGRPWLVIVAVMSLFSLLGTTMGWADETLGFYALLIPLLLALGYDRMAVAGMIIASTTVGALASTVNPFSIGVASEFANVGIGDGIGLRWIGWAVLTALTIAYVVRYAQRVKANPERSLVGLRAEDAELVKKEEASTELTLSGRQKIILAITTFTFVLLVFSVIPWNSIIDVKLETDPITHEPIAHDFWWNLGWWFPELSALFLVAAVVVGLVAGYGERQITGNIVRGFGDFIGAGVAVVLARGVTVILNNTQTIDTILRWMENAVSGTSASGFISILFILNTAIAFIIPSSSGHATLAMPLLAPLGDFANVSRPLVVTGWSWGAGLARFITPTSAVVMAGIALAGVRYDRWIRFMLPLMGILAVASIVMLVIAALLE